MSETKVPALPAVTDSNLTSFARAAKQLLDVREGLVGDPLDANVTFRDLVDAGAVFVRPGWNGRTGSPVMPPWTEPDGYDPTTDLLPPPRPENVQVTGMFAMVMIQFDTPQYRNHAYAEVWRSSTNVLGNAVRIGTTDTRFYTDSVGTSASFYYWVRFVSQANVTGPYNATDGILGETAIDPALVIASLTGQITESQLYSSLAERISLIDAASDVPGSVSFRIAAEAATLSGSISAEAAARTAAITAEANTRSAQIQNEAGARATAILNEASARTAAVGALQTQINTLQAASSGDFGQLLAAVQSEQTARIQADQAEAASRDTLATQLRGSYLGNDPSQLTTGILYNERQARITAEGVLSSSISALSATVTSNQSSITAALTTESQTRASADSALSSSLTTLTSAVNNPTTGLAATRATLINDYYTKTAADSAISSAVTSLSNSVNSTLTGYVTNSALTTNYYTKSATDSAISQATTALNSSINNTLTGYATNASLTQNYYTKTQTDSAISAATSTLVSNTALTTALGAYTTTASLTQNYYTKTQTDSAISSATSSLVSSTALTNTLGSYVTNASLTQNYYTKTQTDSAISSATSTLVSTTALNNALGNYTTTSALQQNYYTKTQADTAISSATQTLVSTTALNNALGSYTTTAALQQAYYTKASAAGLEAQYTVKTDVNGYVSGFGLASTTVGATPTSSFIIRADSFSIANPTGPSVAPAMPFIVRTTATTIGGVNVPVGVYLTDAFIQNGTISNVKIANAAIDNAKIASLDAAKITTGFLSADRIQVGALDAKIANIDAARITSGTIISARIGNASITGAQIANATITDANIASLNANKITAGKITAAYIDGTNLNINAAGVELGHDVGPGAGHYGLSLSDANFNNIFLRRSDGVVFFRINDGGANSLTFDSASGVLNIRGVMSASQIAVGSGTGATTFYDPAQPAVPLNSSANGFLAFSGSTATVTTVPGTCPDGKGGFYNCSTQVYTANRITSDNLLFATNNASIPIGRRIRSGDVRFLVVASGTVDHYLSIWYRIMNSDGTFQNWVHLGVATEPQRDYGGASISRNVTLGIQLGQGVQFAFSATEGNNNYWNPTGDAIYDGTLSVTGVNF